MSSKKHRITSVTREQARTYISKATEFLRSAKEAMINGQHNSAGLLAIHAAISAADAALGHQVQGGAAFMAENDMTLYSRRAAAAAVTFGDVGYYREVIAGSIGL